MYVTNCILYMQLVGIEGSHQLALSATAQEFFKSCITFDPIPTMQNNKIIKLVLYAGNGGQYDSLVDAISCCCRLAPSHKQAIT